MKKLLTLLAVLLVASATLSMALCKPTIHQPTLTLQPAASYGFTMVVGENFRPCQTVTITYDTLVIHTIPNEVKTNSEGSFTAIIVAPDVTAIGQHTITATIVYDCNQFASATYTLLDTKGQDGSQGLQGIQGLPGLDFNATGNISVYNGTNGLDGQNGLDFNATNNIFLFNGTNGKDGKDGMTYSYIYEYPTKGEKGDTGMIGAAGPKGDKGDTGASGTNIVASALSTPTQDLSFGLALGAVFASLGFCLVYVLVARKRFSAKS